MLGSTVMADTAKTKQVNFRIDEETYRFLELLSRVEGTTVTGFCRSLVEKSVDRSRKSEKTVAKMQDLVKADLAFVGNFDQ